MRSERARSSASGAGATGGGGGSSTTAGGGASNAVIAAVGAPLATGTATVAEVTETPAPRIAVDVDAPGGLVGVRPGGAAAGAGAPGDVPLLRGGGAGGGRRAPGGGVEGEDAACGALT